MPDGGTLDARNRAQIFVDRADIVRSEVLVLGPRHHLQARAIERWREAVGCLRGGAIRVDVIEVDDLNRVLAKLTV